MKFIKTAKNIVRNTWDILTTGQPITQRQMSEFMTDQLGKGWMDRLMAVRSTLHPDTVEKIINQANSRSFGNLGQLYELMYYITGESRVGGMLDKRISATSRVMWDLTPGDRDSSDSADATQFLQKYLNDIRFKTFLEQVMDGKLYGVTGFHNVIMESGSRYVFKDPTENQISQSRWWQENNDNGKFGNLYLKAKDKRKIYIDDPEDIHPYQISMFLYKNKNGYYDTTGLLNRIVRLYILKVWTLTFLANSVERHGKPFLWTTMGSKEFNDEEFKSKVRHVLKQFGSERYGIFPEGLELQSLDTASATGHQMHISTIEHCNTEMAVSLLGQNLSTEVKGGSFAATDAHMGVEFRLTETDVEWQEEQINDNWIFPLCAINYPNLLPEQYPVLSLTPVKNVDIEKVSRGFKALSELVDVPVEEIRSRTQVRSPRIKEDADPDATGSDKYDEEVIGPSTRRRNGESILRALGA